MDVKGLALIPDRLLAAYSQTPDGNGKRELADGLVHSPSAKPSALPLPPGWDEAVHGVGLVIRSRRGAAGVGNEAAAHNRCHPERSEGSGRRMDCHCRTRCRLLVRRPDASLRSA